MSSDAFGLERQFSPDAAREAVELLLESGLARGTREEQDLVLGVLAGCRAHGLALPDSIYVVWRRGRPGASRGATTFRGEDVTIYLTGGLPRAELVAVTRHEAFHIDVRRRGLDLPPDIEERGAQLYAGEA